MGLPFGLTMIHRVDVDKLVTLLIPFKVVSCVHGSGRLSRGSYDFRVLGRAVVEHLL